MAADLSVEKDWYCVKVFSAEECCCAHMDQEKKQYFGENVIFFPFDVSKSSGFYFYKIARRKKC